MRPASIRMTLTANGSMVQQVTLSDENGWTATVSGLPADLDGKPIAYAWSEPEITNYTQESTETTGTVTIFTNRIVRIPEELPPDEPQPKKPKGGWRPAVFEDYATAMGGESLFNHTGDCFD